MVRKEIKTICVYCGSSIRVSQSYKDNAARLGELLGQNDYDVVYGGGNVGLMGITATSALDNGADVIGIIPTHLSERETAHKHLTELHTVETMHERKQMMVDRADAFVIMPGGLGTMDEFFEIFTWWQLGLHDKPIIIINVDGYWTPLLDLVQNIATEGFCSQSDYDHLIVLDKTDDIIEALKTAPVEKNDPKTKWI